MYLILFLISITYSLSASCTPTSSAIECYLKALEVLESDKKQIEDSKRMMEEKLVEVKKENEILQTQLNSLKASTDASIASLNTTLFNDISHNTQSITDGLKEVSFKIDSTNNSLNMKIDNLSNSVHNHSCREISTNCQDDGGGNAVFLDRHTTGCDNNEFLKSWRISRCSTERLHIIFICCKIQ